MANIPTIEEVQALLREVPGSFSDAIIEARSDQRFNEFFRRHAANAAEVVSVER